MAGLSRLKNGLLVATAITFSTGALAQTTHLVPDDFATIEAAYAAAASDDIISIVQAGTYAGAGFAEVRNITVRNDSGGVVVLNSPIVIAREGSTAAEFDVVLEGLEFRPFPIFAEDAIDIGAGARNITIRNCSFYEGDFSISSAAETVEEHTLLVEDSYFKDNNWGIVSFGNAQVTVRNSDFIDNTNNCINMQGQLNTLTAEGCKFLIENSTLGLNPAGGLVYFANFGLGTEHDIINCVFDFHENPPAFSTLLQCNNTSEVRINHSTFGRTSFHSAYMFGAGNLVVRNTIFTGAIGMWAFTDTGATGNSDYCLFADSVGTPHSGSATSGPNDLLSGDPAFVGTGDDPYDITETSVAVNAANPVSSIIEDLLGRSRPAGQADIGAYEFPQAVVEPTLGDINNDGVVNVADVTELANFIEGIIGSIEGDGDVNGDEAVNSADVTALVDLIVNP